MKLVQHTLTAYGAAFSNGRARPDAVGNILRLIGPAVGSSVDVGFRRSSGPGRRPDWLKATSDIRLRHTESLGADSMRFVFDAPRFGDVAAELYDQGQLFDEPPSRSDTAFDLFADVLSDVSAQLTDSERFDTGVLRRLERFRKPVFGAGVELVEIGGDRLKMLPGRMTGEIIDKAATLHRQTPPPSRVRVSGKLDMIRDSDRVFVLQLPKGEEVRGVWVGDDAQPLREFFGKQVMVAGIAMFRPSKALFRIDADTMTVAGANDIFFAQIPRPFGQPLDLKALAREQRKKGGIAAIWGTIDAEESEEEFLAAIEEMS